VEKTLKQRPDLIQKGREFASDGSRVFSDEVISIIDRLTTQPLNGQGKLKE
jgi:hypothetical protein